jgi:hypothetical protein
VVDRGLDVRSATRPVCPDGMRSAPDGCGLGRVVVSVPISLLS